MKHEGFEFVGFTVIFAIAALLIYSIQTSVQSPTVIAQIGLISPWAALHIVKLSWFAIGVVMIAALAANPILMMRSTLDGDSALGGLGKFTWSLLLAYGLLALIPSIGFLIGIGWFGAKQLVGH
jgi:hypothetical protein